MTRLVAVSRETHAQKVWQRPANFLFAAKEPLAPIVLAEFMLVGSWMPIVFVQQAGRYVAMALMSPMPGNNLFIGPDGQWLGGYVPTSLRGYPFRAVRAAPESEQMTLCIDEDSGLVKDADEKGESFLTADGKPTQSLASLLDFFRQVESSRVATDLAMASLAEAGVIELWPLQVEVDGKKTAINDLYRVNESALGQVDDEVFLKLRKTSGLPLAYAQMMSMAQVVRFEQLMKLRQQLAQTPKIKPEEIFKGEPSDLIRFD
jgi:SapC